MAATSASSRSDLRPASATAAPAPASTCANRRPSPLVAPVTSATSPLSGPSFICVRPFTALAPLLCSA
jgi:hypothetical protein